MAIDPDCLKIHALYAAAKRPPLEQQTPAEARDGMSRSRPILQPDPPEMGEVRALSAPGPAGAIPLRLYRPKGAAPATLLPALVYYHGGGWVIGDLDSHDVLCRQLSNASGAAVVSVDYRLAPEHRFPAAVDDADAALNWIAANAASLGIDGTRLAVGGDSAGGNLAAVAAIMARDQGGPALRLQLLIYPAVDFAAQSASYVSEANVLPLTDKAMIWFQDHYLGATKGQSAQHWRASPLRAASHANLPRAFILTAQHDVLRDEGDLYSNTLEAAGVGVGRVRFPGMIHGFITMGRIVPAADKAVAACAAALRKAMA
jgi:acetyl esterase